MAMRSGEPIVQASSSGGSKRHSARRIVVWATPDVRAAEEELRIGVPTRMTPVEPWTKHVGKQAVIDPCIGVSTEVPD